MEVPDLDPLIPRVSLTHQVAALSLDPVTPRGPVKLGEIIEETEEIECTDSSSEDDEIERILLAKISPHFHVKTTNYGGRGCFANGLIKKGTTILSVHRPVGSAVVRPFRKEVCTWCFQYYDGRTLKHRLQQKVYFCSEICLNEFSIYDPHSILANTLVHMEDLYVKCQGEIDESKVPKSLEELLEVMESRWAEVAEWETRISRMKPSKRLNNLPVVTEDDYAEIRYVIMTLYSLYCDDSATWISKAYMLDMDDKEVLTYEKKLFELLYSSELDKMKRYPYLLESYTNIYKFVRLVSPDEFLPYVTPKSIRDIIGRNLTNAFGVWSPITQEEEEREFFGFGVYPSGSFFNHSCEFNVTKIRKNASYEYVTVEDVAPGAELCISYGIRATDSVEERRKALSEWFFHCGCTRCVAEAGM